MNKIDGNEILDLMFLSMTDNRVIEMIDRLGMEQPIIDEKYEIEGSTSVYNDSIGFTFKEIDGFSDNGSPCITGISFMNSKNIILPYGLKFENNYTECKELIGRNEDYLNDWDDEVKIWIISDKFNKIALGINYKDEKFNSIHSIVFFYFEDSNIGEIYIPN